jgi:hypothetical protein
VPPKASNAFFLSFGLVGELALMMKSLKICACEKAGEETQKAKIKVESNDFIFLFDLMI